MLFQVISGYVWIDQVSSGEFRLYLLVQLVQVVSGYVRLGQF